MQAGVEALRAFLRSKPLAAIVDGFASTGISRDAIEAHVIAEHRASGRTSFEAPGAAFDVWAAAYKRRFPPCSALFAGSTVVFGAYDVLDYLIASCDTLAEGMRQMPRYFRLVAPGGLEVDEAGDAPGLTFSNDKRDQDWFSDEFTCGVLVGRFREGTGIRFPVRARFQRPAPKGDVVDRVRSFLGDEPEFGAPISSMRLPRQVWSAPLRSTNPRLREALERHAAELVAELASPQPEVVAAVRRVVTERVKQGEPTLDVVAKMLATTPRTLQRRLQSVGIVYQELVDDVRAGLARRCLDDERLSIVEVAFLLGYSDASAFGRAFKRWTGKTPTDWRRGEGGG